MSNLEGYVLVLSEVIIKFVSIFKQVTSEQDHRAKTSYSWIDLFWIMPLVMGVFLIMI